jgi:hypothetical protein
MAQKIASTLYDAVLGRWLWQLFRNGPLWLGCWSGLPDVDVCSRIAGATGASDWQAAYYSTMPSARCTELIRRTFAAYATLVHTLVYAACLYVLARAALHAAGRACARTASRQKTKPAPKLDLDLDLNLNLHQHQLSGAETEPCATFHIVRVSHGRK